MALVTIISDASYCPRTHAAGYGFWAVSERGRHGGSGSFKAKLPGSLFAETCAIVNALFIATRLGIAAAGDRVLVQTDCQVAIRALEGKMKRRTINAKRNVLLRDAVERFNVFVREHALTIEFRYVQGHSRVQDQRSKAQRHADARARAGMEKARAKVVS